MKTKQWFYLTAVCVGLSLSVPSASGLHFQPAESDAAQTNAREDQLYSDATSAINESRWSDAESLLNQVIGQHGRRAVEHRREQEVDVVAVRQHHALRASGRAAGEEDDERVVLVDRHRRGIAAPL